MNEVHEYPAPTEAGSELMTVSFSFMKDKSETEFFQQKRERTEAGKIGAEEHVAGFLSNFL